MYDIESVYRAASIDDALDALARDPQAVVISGGTDVLIAVREGKLAGRRLVSIHDIGELTGVRMDADGAIHIGAGTTFTELSEHPLIQQHVPTLGRAAEQVGSPQIRAVGTVGGNVCNGVTSADTASTLTAYDAVMRVRRAGGARDIPISEWYLAAGKAALEAGELLTEIVIPRAHYKGFGGCYIKYAMRNAMDIATLGVACLCKLTPDKGRIESARLAFGVAGPVPMRAPTAEAAVVGLTVDEAAEQIGREALVDLNPRTSWRASKEFRTQLIKELPGRALCAAAEEARVAL